MEPLYTLGTFVWFDRYAGGAPYGDEDYIRHFRRVLHALREKRRLRIRFRGGTRARHQIVCIPYWLEYFAKDDKFHLLTAGIRRDNVINLARVKSCQLLEKSDADSFCPPEKRLRSSSP